MHGAAPQGLAAACSMLDPRVGCTIVMPGDAPASKEARARSYGAVPALFYNFHCF